MSKVRMTVNGKAVTRDIPDHTLLVQFLREDLRLTGTHVGCDSTQCGACTVHLNGDAIKSCTALALSCDGGEVTTIEGLASDGRLHPMQEAFREHHGLQCGYCTPGFVMAGIKIAELLGPDADEHELREEMDGNICRCTGYHNIVTAIRAGARAMAKGEIGDPIGPAPDRSDAINNSDCEDKPPTRKSIAEFAAKPDLSAKSGRTD